MPASYRIELTFTKADESTTKMTYKYANANTEASDINALMDAIIANGTIFKNVPVAKKAAKLIESTETEYSMS